MNQQFKTNLEVKYRVGGVYNPTHQFSLVNQEIWVNKNNKFDVRFLNIWVGYKLPKITDLALYDVWSSNSMQFWQTQLNFAIWCATSGCGVSKQHLRHNNHLIRSVYRFHAYYQIRRILRQLECPLPGDKYFDATNNNINLRSYTDLCDEFGISKSSDFRQKLDSSNGMGSVVYYSLHGLRPQKKKLERGGDYDKERGIVFIPQTGFASGPPHRYKVEYLEQYFAKGVNPTKNKVVPLSEQPVGSQFDAIGSFVLDEGKGFTQAGISRINDSIRTFVWAILGAQSQARTSLLGIGKAFDAQRQFLANVKTAIKAAADIPESITRYQDTLGYARSKVDFVVGFDLYMMPSDMDLFIGKINGYNNLLVDASESDIPLVLGHNDEANDSPPIIEDAESSIPKPTPKNEVTENPDAEDTESSIPKPTPKTGNGATPHAEDTESSIPKTGDEAEPNLTHEEQKLLLIIGGGAAISALIWALG